MAQQALQGFRVAGASVAASPSSGRRAPSAAVPGAVASRRQGAVSLHGSKALSSASITNPGAIAARSLAASRAGRRAPATVAAVAEATKSSTGCPRGGDWAIHKFGGTCVASAERIMEVAKVMVEDKSTARKCIVVSAMGTPPTGGPKVTDILLTLVAKAAARDKSYLDELEVLYQKHMDCATEIVAEGPLLSEFTASLSDGVSNLKAMLKAIEIAGVSTENFEDYVVGHGELWNAAMMAMALRKLGANVDWMDTREVLVVTPTQDDSVDVDYGVSNGKMDDWFNDRSDLDIVVATGFIAKNPEGVPCTLKRNGSDYSATILGAMFQCSLITIWTDVSGVYSADPRTVLGAVCLEKLSYNEAWELSYFGANVLHPRTTLPAMKFKIPICIRNFFELSSPGTLITDAKEELNNDPKLSRDGLVKGFATIDNITLISVEGTGMVGVPGTASGIFSAVRDAGVNVVMISQASSEHSICFAVRSAEEDQAVAAIKLRFAEALAKGGMAKVEKISGCSILAAVGQNMNHRKGVSATLFSALAKANVNIRAIAQGCSEYNITVVVDQVDSAKALQSAHSQFYLSDVSIAVGLVGPGLIGKTLLEQIKQQQKVLQEEYNIDLRITAVCGSKTMVLKDAISIDDWEETYRGSDTPVDLEAFGKHVNNDYFPNSVIIDCTASDVVADHYESWMKQGIHIVTPNKKLNSGDLERYQRVRELGREMYTHYFSEASVGAGLPIINTLRSIKTAGDKIVKIEGIFSGTLSYIFNTFQPGDNFSDIVKQAKELGFTEPDPRDDLSGTDVARKVVTLAREAGLMLELEDVPVESLVPEPLRDTASVEEYMSRLPDFDGEMSEKMAEAEANGEVLRFVGTVDVASNESSVALKAFPKTHPFATLQGADNIISFTTRRYADQPLIVRGPGAGAEVTAQGVFGDILMLAAYLGAPS
mmetsp:Transcript_23921/g.74812  ORF Transcript_23921/g.74812 Transcript_23921/m.74812 type:complete len:938 (-) Transcript_23921:174-2987(-)